MTDERPLSSEEREAMEAAYARYLSDREADPRSQAGLVEVIWRAALSFVHRRAGEGEDEHDDARHITWDHGRRTLCGKGVAGDPGDFYLPLGEAPRHDEGGAWCWSCLQLQDEAALSAQRAGEGEEIERLIGELEAGVPWTNAPWKDADEAVRSILVRLRKMASSLQQEERGLRLL